MKFKVGDIVSYMGSKSLGLIIRMERGKSKQLTDQAWVKPMCGSVKWMNPVRGRWLVGVDQMHKVPLVEQELCRVLFL